MRSSDPTAFVADLFTTHVDELRRFGRSLVPAHEVDDLVSQAFANVLRALRNGRGPTDSSPAYLRTTVRHAAYTRARTKLRQPTVALPEVLDALPELAVHDELPPEHDPCLAAAFDGLSDRHRRVLWETLVEERPLAEVADGLGVSPSAAAALSYRARTALRRAYDGHPGRLDPSA